MPDHASPNASASPHAMRKLELRDIGRVPYSVAWELQQQLEARRKAGEICDQLLLVEHPHVLTLGRNGRMENLILGRERLAELGIEFFEINRGGDITYHGPGQIVCYPIFDLREWKRDVVAYVRAIEQVIMDSLAEFGIEATRLEGCTGVWVKGKKVAAIGIHISRWVTSHGFALNHTTALSYFQYIVPCGLTKPVTSIRELSSTAGRDDVTAALARNFAKAFHFEMHVPILTETFS